MPGRSDYEERKQARIDRLNGAASKARQESDKQYQHSHDLVKDIPLGQPNIIGRPALPRLREKSFNALGKAVENDEKAAYYTDRAEAAESNTAISSDDPEAIQKLKEKLAALEAKRERIKAYNKEARKNGTEKAPWYELPYTGKAIKDVKERIAKLEAVDAMPAELIEFERGEIESDPETNRVMVRFDERQPDDVIDKFKANGFKWASSVGAWQRIRTPGTWRLLKRLCGIERNDIQEDSTDGQDV